MKKNFLAIVAVTLAIATTAFTKAKKLDSDLVWFEVHATAGTALNSVDGGRQGDNPPMSCPTGNKYCSAALSISQGEVVDNNDGTFGITSGVDISDPGYFNQRRTKN